SVVGIVGTIIQPWSVYEILTQALLLFGAVPSAINGVLVVDYHLPRKRRVNVRELYLNDGQYKSDGGVNIEGFIAWVIGSIVAIIFMDYSFIVGFVVAGVVYYLLAKYWYFNKFPQAEIEDPSDEKYLGITVARDWLLDEDLD